MQKHMLWNVHSVLSHDGAELDDTAPGCAARVAVKSGMQANFHIVKIVHQ